MARDLIELATPLLVLLASACATHAGGSGRQGAESRRDAGDAAWEAAAADAGEDADAGASADSGDGDAPSVVVPPDGSPCTEPLARLVPGPGFTDPSSLTSMVACAEVNSGVRQAVRVDLLGSPVCEDLDVPCLLGDGGACVHDCITDADCGPNALCVCAAAWDPPGDDGQFVTAQQVGRNRCFPADCSEAADCGGWACGLTKSNCGPTGEAFRCRTAHDECTTDAQCAPNSICRFLTDRWVCDELISCD